MNIKGRITTFITGYLDICFDCFFCNNKERYYLVPRLDYPEEAYCFEIIKRGKMFIIKLLPKETFFKREKFDFKILNYCCAE